MPVCRAVVGLALIEEKEDGAFAGAGESLLLCVWEEKEENENGLISHSTASSMYGCKACTMQERKGRRALLFKGVA